MNLDTIATRPHTADSGLRVAALGQPGKAEIALIDGCRLRRECMKVALMQHNSGWNILDLATASDLLLQVEDGEGGRTVERARSLSGPQFDLVLIGAATSDEIDLDEIAELRAALPDTPVVVAADNDNQQRARLILKAGSRGFLPTSLSIKVLMGALDLVMAGGVYVPSSLLDGAPQRAPVKAGTESFPDLTRRQRDVLVHISQGKSNKLIADALSMSESTVKAHVKQIIKRMRVANRTQAALLASGLPLTSRVGAVPASPI